MIKENQRILNGILVVIDIIVILISLVLAYYVRFKTTIFGPFVGVGFSLMAVQYTEAGIASTLMALTPIIIILPSYWLFQQKITWKAVVGAFISVIGVSLFFLG